MHPIPEDCGELRSSHDEAAAGKEANTIEPHARGNQGLGFRALGFRFRVLS